MTFGWVVGYTPGVLKMNTQIEQFPYPRPIMFNFQLLRNDDHKQIHKSKYWFDNFFGEPDPIPLFFGGGTKNRLFQQLRVEYSKCPRLNSTHEIAQWNWCAPGETLAGTVSGCSGRIRKNLKMPFPYRINGKWYIYLLIYHPKSNYECRCRCIPCMVSYGIVCVFLLAHFDVLRRNVLIRAGSPKKTYSMLMVPNSKSDWECQPKACLNNKNTSIGYKI